MKKEEYWPLPLDLAALFVVVVAVVAVVVVDVVGIYRNTDF